MHELLAPLNEKQRVAVEATDGPVLILAGAGSGKTKTLIHRIAYIIATKKAKPYNILAVTFTNKASKELKNRLHTLLGNKITHYPVMGTFHSVCVQILRREIPALGYNAKFVIYDDNDTDALIKKVMKDQGLDTKVIAPGLMKHIISKAKNDLLTPSDFEAVASDVMDRTAAQVYSTYQTALKNHNALDFDDLIRLTVQIFKDFPEVLQRYQQAFQYILVDEYQDTNHAQYMLIDLLAHEHKNICVVGDDYQSIYSWRGANLQNILDFEDDYKKSTVILLEQNYRSSQHILEAANEIIKYNVKQKDKKLWTENGRGHKITIKEVADEKEEGEFIIREIFDITEKTESGDSRITEDTEIKYVDEGDGIDQDTVQPTSLLDRIMQSRTFQGYQADQKLQRSIKQQLPLIDLRKYVILYRTNAQSRALEESFLRYNVPYRIIGGMKFYDRREIKDLIAYLRSIVNPADWVSVERIVNVPARSLGANSWKKIEAQCRSLGVNYLEIPPEQLPLLRPQQHDAFIAFQELMKSLNTKMEKLSPSESLDLVVKLTHFKDQYNTKLPEDLSRLENIEELKSVTSKFDNQVGSTGILAMLEDVALVSDQDDVNDFSNAVNLMTVHAAKGLEFDTVFITGMEEGLFPHARSLFQPSEMEEERRLCYVALTRAKRKAYFVYAGQRTVYGATQITAPSRFLKDIPKELVDRR
ncbi:MAG: UvrD-helicase domain-containing protein [Candidatus Kerfeldbacteria bacterium]|nr:UvrD-helicase domain-containing protein [Candidatus Kerfeldbacteria bacterium]